MTRTSAQARIAYILGIQVRFRSNKSLCAWGMSIAGGDDERSVVLRSAQSSHTHSSEPFVRRPALVTTLTRNF